MTTRLAVFRSKTLQRNRCELIWRALCELGETMHAGSLHFVCQDDQTSTVKWQRDSECSTERTGSLSHWTLTYSIPMLDQSHIAVTLYGTADRLPKADEVARWIRLVGAFADAWSREEKRDKFNPESTASLKRQAKAA